MADGEKESGWKWWLRYVVVPLIGGGGILSVVVAFMTTKDLWPSRPTPQPEATPVRAAQSKPSPSPGESNLSSFFGTPAQTETEFYFVREGEAIHRTSGNLAVGDVIIVFWKVKGVSGLYLQRVTPTGPTGSLGYVHTFLPLESHGSMTVQLNVRNNHSFMLQRGPAQDAPQLAAIEIFVKGS